jgi:methylated-DNA-[protein]-cysteine S-methyltransferase
MRLKYGIYGAFVIMKTPIGYIKITAEDGLIVSVCIFDNKINNITQKAIKIEDMKVLNNCEKQLNMYFKGKLKKFDVEYKFRGTDFQNKVWTELTKIEYGTTISYKELAIRINNNKACRAVGGANNKNNIAIIVPCHRVIGNNGSMVGYASRIDKKEYLLELENKYRD